MRQNYIAKLKYGPGNSDHITKLITNFNYHLFFVGYRSHGPQIVKPVQRSIPTSNATGPQLLALAGVKLVGSQRL